MITLTLMTANTHITVDGECPAECFVRLLLVDEQLHGIPFKLLVRACAGLIETQTTKARIVAPNDAALNCELVLDVDAGDKN